MPAARGDQDMRQRVVRVAAGAAIVLSAVVLATPIAWLRAAEPVTVTFLHFNDFYEISPKGGKGGFAPLMTPLEQERATAAHTITAFGGDLLIPSVLSGLVKGEQMIELTKAIDVDVAVPGNHEFDFGAEVAAARFAASDYVWLAANMVGPDGEPIAGTEESRVIEVGGYRIGIFGLVSPETATLSSPGPDIRFADPFATAEKLVAELRQAGADLVVALTHLDLAEDRELLQRVAGIDIVLGGHDHDPITFYEDGSLLVKAGHDGHYLVAVDVRLERIERRGQQVVVWTPEWRYRSTAGIEPHPEIAALVARWEEKLAAELDVPVGRPSVELDTRRDTVRTAESAFGNLVADAMRISTGADVAITNGGGIRGDRVYAPGTTLTRRDILTELPFGNVTVVVELTGAEIIEALENGVARIEDKAGRFPQVSGLRFTYDPAKPAGSRIVSVEIGGKPLDPARSYRVATNDYLLSGGDGYAVLGRGRVIIDASAGTLMATTVMDHVAALGGEIAPQLEGRILRLQ